MQTNSVTQEHLESVFRVKSHTSDASKSSLSISVHSLQAVAPTVKRAMKEKKFTFRDNLMAKKYAKNDLKMGQNGQNFYLVEVSTAPLPAPRGSPFYLSSQISKELTML